MSSVGLKEKPISKEENPRGERQSKKSCRITLMVLFFAGFSAGLAWLYSSETLRESKAKRLAFLVEEAKNGHKFDSELRAELCSLWQEVNETEALTEEECIRLADEILLREVDSFLTAIRPCSERIRAHYNASEPAIAGNEKGFLFKFDTVATVIEVRMMHKSSGSHWYKTGKHTFRIRSDHYYLNEDGVQSSNKNTHHYFTECPEEQIHQIIKKHIKWRRYKGKHIKK